MLCCMPTSLRANFVNEIKKNKNQNSSQAKTILRKIQSELSEFVVSVSAIAENRTSTCLSDGDILKKTIPIV